MGYTVILKKYVIIMTKIFYSDNFFINFLN